MYLVRVIITSLSNKYSKLITVCKTREKYILKVSN